MTLTGRNIAVKGALSGIGEATAPARSPDVPVVELLVRRADRRR